MVAGLDVGAVVIGALEVGQDELHGAQGEAVGVVGRHDGDVGLEGVREDVDAGGGGQALGLGHHVVGVDDGHVGQELVVSDRPLGAGVGVGDDRERRDLGTRAGGGGDGHEEGLLAHLRERVDALADVHEVHGHVLELGLGVLVHHPHDLAGVHRGAAADGDDAVGLEGLDLLEAALAVLELGVGRDGPEARVDDALLVEGRLDLLGEAALVEEGVGDDEGALLAVDLGELAQGHGHAALLEEDLLGNTEPQHVLTPLCDGLDVEQVLGADVARDGVAAPGAAAERQRRRHLEVVDVADAALGGRGVDEDAARLHALGVLGHLLGLARVDEQRARVAVAAVGDEALGLGEGVLPVLGAIHAEDGGELLVGPGLGGLDGLDLADEHLGAGGDGHAGGLGDLGRGLADHLGVDAAVDDDGVADLGDLVALEEVAAALLELGLDLVVDLVEDDDVLLGGADHAVVEGLGVDDRVDGELDVGGVVDDGGVVARADAQGGLAGGVRGVDHARATGGEDDVGGAHELGGHVEGRDVDPVDDALGGAGGLGGLAHDAGGLGGALAGARVRGDEDRVAGLQGDERLEDRGGGGVGRRDDGGDDAERLGDLLVAEGGVVGDDVARLHVLVLVVDVLGGIVVLDDLVLHDAVTGLLDGHLGQRDAGLVGGHGGLIEDLVHLLLGERRELGLRDAHLLDALLQRLDAVDRGPDDVCHAFLLFLGPCVDASAPRSYKGQGKARLVRQHR